MKLQDYNIYDIIQALGISYRGDRFQHRCPDGGSKQGSRDARIYGDNTFFCFRCAGLGGSGLGGNYRLISDTLGVDSHAEVSKWMVANFPDYSAEISYESLHPFHIKAKEVLSTAVNALLDSPTALAFLDEKYKAGDKQITEFKLGLITEEVIEKNSEFFNDYDCEHLLNYIIIPIIQNGEVYSFTCRRCDPLVNEDKKSKYYVLTDPSFRGKVPVFNYDMTKSLLKNNIEKIQALYICESEFDVISLNRIGERTAVSVASLTSQNTFQRLQVSELVSFATCGIVLFDNDGEGKQEKTSKQTATFCKNMLLNGKDLKILTLPDAEDRGKVDVSSFLLDEDNVDYFRQLVVECVQNAPTFLTQYIEENRINFKKEAVTDAIFTWIAHQPSKDWDSYAKQISRLPKHFISSPIREDLKIESKEVIKCVKSKVKHIQKKINRDLRLSITAEKKVNHYYNHDFWISSDGTHYAQRLVWADVETTLLTEEGEVDKIIRTPILLTTKTNSEGMLSIHNIEKINVDELDEDESMLLPIDKSRMSSLSPWSVIGDAGYTFNEFITSEGTIHLDFSELYNEIRSFINKYIYFKNDAYSVIMTSFVCLSYLYMKIASVPYLHITGAKGTGKSTLGKMLSSLCFCPITMVLARATHLFREAHSSRGTIFFDEAEVFSGKNQSESAQDMILMCNSSYTKTEDAGVPRYDKDKSGKLRLYLYNAYSPKVFMSINYLKDSLKSRCITIEAAKIPKEQGLKYPTFENDLMELYPKLQTLRNKLNVWALREHKLYYDTFKVITEEVRRKGTIQNRDQQLWVPLLTVIRLAGCKEDEKKITEFYTNFVQKQTESMSSSDEMVLLQFLDDAISKVPEEGQCPLGFFNYGGSVWITQINLYGEFMRRFREYTQGHNRFCDENSNSLKQYMGYTRRDIFSRKNISFSMLKSTEDKRGQVVFSINVNELKTRIKEMM